MNDANDVLPTTLATHGPATRIALSNLKRLKPEHRELLGQMIGDGGMAASTLETLVEHLLEEEDPALLFALSRVKAGASTLDVALAATTQNLGTVGDLRRQDSQQSRPTQPGSTVGNLRK